jgi:hypothetical protein
MLARLRNLPRKEDDIASTLGTKDSIVRKTSGLNLEHVFSTDAERLKAYYYLLQIAHIILQVFEVSSFLRDIAAGLGRPNGCSVAL